MLGSSKVEILSKDDAKTVVHALALHGTSALYLGTHVWLAWINLDTCSTIASFMNPKLLQDVRDCKPGKEMKVLLSATEGQCWKLLKNSHTTGLKVLSISIFCR